MRRLTLALLASAIACTGCASGMRAAVPNAAAGGLAEVVASDDAPTAIAASTISDNEPVVAPKRMLAAKPGDVPAAKQAATPKKKSVPGNAVPGLSERRSEATRSSLRASSAGYQQPNWSPTIRRRRSHPAKRSSLPLQHRRLRSSRSPKMKRSSIASIATSSTWKSTSVPPRATCRTIVAPSASRINR